MAKYVVANCTSADEARSTVNDLIDKGYPRDSISLMAKESVVSKLGDTGAVIEQDYDYETAPDETMWERFKGFFGFEGGADKHDSLWASHQDDIRSGNILVIVDDAYVPDTLQGALPSMDTGYWHAGQAEEPAKMADHVSTGDETIRLQEERLNVDKENVQGGEVVIKKRVVEENETIDVPVRHEELVVERHAVTGAQAGTGGFDEETITIPLMEEEVHVTKTPVVTEEVRLHKRGVQDTKHVSATVRKEELDMDKLGDAIVAGQNVSPTAAPPQ